MWNLRARMRLPTLAGHRRYHLLTAQETATRTTNVARDLFAFRYAFGYTLDRTTDASFRYNF